MTQARSALVRRWEAWLVALVLAAVSVAGGAGAYLLVGHAQDHYGVANAAVDLNGETGELVGVAQDLAAPGRPSGALLATSSRREQRAHELLRVLVASGDESEDVGPYAPKVGAYLARLDQLRRAAVAGDAPLKRSLLRKQIDSFRHLSVASAFIVREMRGSATDAADLARNGVLALGLAVAATISAGLWWLGDRRRQQARADAEYASRARFAAIVEHSDDLIAIIDGDGRIQYVSPSVPRVLGGTFEDYDGALIDSLIEMHTTEEEHDVGASLERLAASPGMSGVLQHTMFTRDGQPRSFESVATNLLDDPAVRGIVINSRDVTERRHFEARQEAILDRSHDLTMLFQQDGTVVWASPACKRMLGYEPAELEGRLGLSLIHPDDQEHALEAFLSVPNLGDSVRVRYRVSDASGRTRWLEEVATNLIGDPDVGFVVANLRDVTEEQEARHALEAQEAQHRSILETAHEGIWVSAADGSTVFANPAMAEMLATNVGRLEARRITEFVSPEDRPVIASVEHLARAGSLERTEVRLVREDGFTLWASVSAGPLHGAAEPEQVLYMVSDITARRRAEEELRHLALHDLLTGLPNRRLLNDRLEHALTRTTARPAALLHVDLDEFKDVNDSLGHAAGDQVIVEAGRRLRRAARAQDTVARAGGDEFLVLCDEVEDINEAVGIAERLMTALSGPFMVRGSEIVVTASIGVSIAPPFDASSMLRRADVAKHRAKSEGGNRVAVADMRHDDAVRERIQMQGELRRALNNDEFVLCYQPIVDLETCRVAAVEALVRWRHPQRGILAPDTFIPVAERCGLIEAVGRRVLQIATREMRAWALEHRPMRFSVNVAAAHLADPDLYDQIETALREAELEPSSLTVEVTEGSAMRDPQVAADNLRRLRELGVGVALDDFGTGFSSLSFLKGLPVNAVKIDKSFVAGLGQRDEDTQIVAGVVSMGRALGHVVIAEGVERVEQRDALRALGCQFGQGFLWSPGVPERALHEVVASIEADRVRRRIPAGR
jgi:diguanylate cyclase (GGDEF)-like protein/PAS domain S-box-containing protein